MKNKEAIQFFAAEALTPPLHFELSYIMYQEQGIEINAILEFEKEIDMMTTIRHSHIVNLLGICTDSLPFYIIMGKK